MIRRLLRFSLTGLAAVCLLLCVAACVLWVRSYRTRDRMEFQRRDCRWEVASDKGRLWLNNEPQRKIENAQMRRAVQEKMREVEVLRAAVLVAPRRVTEATLRDIEMWKQRRLPAGAISPDTEAARAESSRRHAALMSFKDEVNEAYGAWFAGPQTSAVNHSTPLVVPVAAMAALPALWMMLMIPPWRRRRARGKRGQCLQCGYDIRATPEDQGRYPLNYASRIGAD
jgi:hypothetical protein